MKIAVIGAGAAGMFAAVCAAERGAEVCLYEHMEEAGKKLLMTGNGKCNLTNLYVDGDCYYSDSDKEDILWQVLDGFTPTDTIAWFQQHGLMTRNRDGYIYPYCEQAAVVREVLLRSLEKAGVEICYGYDCYRSLKQLPDGAFLIGNREYDRLILACGGKSARHTGSDGSGYELAKKFGHHIIEPKPALVQLHTNLPEWKQLAGVRAQGSVTIHGHTQTGELQFTEYGISGIAVFQLSRLAVKEGFSKPVEAYLDLCPEYPAENLKEIVIDRISRLKSKPLLQALSGTIHTKILAYLLSALHLSEKNTSDFSGCQNMQYMQDTVDRIVNFIKHMPVPITGSHKLDAAQVTQGGIPLYEVDASLQSVFTKGLYFAGEMMDVDGICGGYNLQWAWASGHVAACRCTPKV